MIAIKERSYLGSRTVGSTTSELFELLLSGDSHWDPAVSSIFVHSRQLASRAVAENSQLSLVVSALLFHPCQILACGSLQAGAWTADSLHETGTYDWLVNHFGDECGETIRLQHDAQRYVSTVIPKFAIPKFAQSGASRSRSVIYYEGGLMSEAEKSTFESNRYSRNAIKLASWIEKGKDPWLDVPEMDFFIPFIERALEVC
jgi:predicted HD phosphohydrolase